MLETLLESGSGPERRTGAALAALVLHGALIVAAVTTTGDKAIGGQGRELPPIRLELLPLGAEAEREPHTRVPEVQEPDLPGPPSVPSIDFSGPRMDLRFRFPSVALPAVDPSPLSLTSPGQTGGSSPLDTVLATASVDRLPELVNGLNPGYPEVLQGSSLSGVVELEYVISAAGKVEASTVQIRTSTHVAFSRSARDALRDARFTPALVRGRPVPVLVRQRIRFRSR